ncbi:hypothetical protein CEXT_606131 [Caerostris extrusa]|uniref:Secreted protein n=1 Tax=Caerostris extrusa TaxID=172846 RepID=A0AAV4SIM2_CAEEX|nr:hypothetical protein CEXT_606131 [Caerostris extrusa]
MVCVCTSVLFFSFSVLCLELFLGLFKDDSQHHVFLENQCTTHRLLAAFPISSKGVAFFMTIKPYFKERGTLGGKTKSFGGTPGVLCLCIKFPERTDSVLKSGFVSLLFFLCVCVYPGKSFL